jgi:hypothetical protein
MKIGALLIIFRIMHLISTRVSIDNFFKIENFMGAKEKEYLKVKNILDDRFVLVTWNQFFDGDDSVWKPETQAQGNFYIIDTKRSIIKFINKSSRKRNL